jgi:hypothetical protein
LIRSIRRRCVVSIARGLVRASAAEPTGIASAPAVDRLDVWRLPAAVQDQVAQRGELAAPEIRAAADFHGIDRR